jgi:hypothetical protein
MSDAERLSAALKCRRHRRLQRTNSFVEAGL